MKWTLDQVARATGGRLHAADPAAADLVITAVTTDSRAAEAGGLFVALHGEQHDGHDFVDDAAARGAVAALVERPVDRLPAVVVADTVGALIELATVRRGELHVPVVAVTGSTGKTSTKDFLAAALGRAAWVSPRSYNNEIGVPLTVLGAPDDAAVLVVEVGSRGIGHIRRLAGAVRPDVSVITNVGPAHLETFGSVERVLIGKWELIEALGPEGVAVLPADDPRLATRGRVGRVTFGRAADADIRVVGERIDEAGRPSFDLVVDAERWPVTLPVAGMHQSLNAAAAIGAVAALGRPVGEAIDRLTDTRLSPWRMEIIPGRFTVVNDAYNANPASTAAALETVAAMAGRKIAVLGLMAELGADSEAEHRRIGRLAGRLGIRVVVVGDPPGLLEGAGDEALAAADADEASRLVRAMVQPGDVVLVKASRAVGLERVAEALTDEAQQ